MQPRLVPVDDLVTVHEIAERLRMSVNAASNLATGRDGRAKLKFPKPLAGRGRTAVWLWSEVEAWYEQVAPKTVEARRRASRAAAMTYKRPNWNQGKRSA